MTTVFIECRESCRTRKTAIQIGLSLGAAGIGVAIAAYWLPGIVGAAGLVLAICAIAVACPAIWRFFTGATHEVHISNEGISDDGCFWPWEVVRSIRSTTLRAKNITYLVCQRPAPMVAIGAKPFDHRRRFELGREC